MNKCPEINSKAWKALVEQVSEDTAWALWAYYGGNYPVALAAKSTIHKEIGYQKIMTEDQVIRMAKKLKAYNTANNTSHSFSKSPVRDNTAYEVTMYYSYWPKKPMTQLIEAKAFKYTNKEEGAKAFVNNHPEIYMQEGNQFFKDGEIYPSYEDALNDDLLPMTIKPGVKELFDNNPELANQVYEALDFIPSKLSYKQIETILYRSNGIRANLFPDLKGLYSNSARLKGFNISHEKASINFLSNILKEAKKGEELRGSYNQIKKFVDEAIDNIYKENYAKATELGERALSLLHDDISRQLIREEIENISNESSFLTPQQKQQALQLYSQYLDTKNRLYRSESSLRADESKAPAWLLEQPEIKAQQEAQGRWFYKSLQEALEHLKKFDGDKITYIDVNENIENYNARDNKFAGGYGREGREYFVPKEVGLTRQNLGSNKDIEGFKQFVSNKEMLQEEDMYPMSFIGTEKSMRPKFQALIDSYRERVKMYRKQINNLELEYKKANSTDRTKLSDRIANLERNIDKLVGDDEKSGVIEDILKLNALEDIQEYAEDQFNEVNRILSQDNISLDEKKFVQYVIDLWIKAGDFSTRENLFWTEDELEEIENNDTLKAIKLKFNEYKNRAEDIQRKVIIPMEEQLVVDTIDTMFDIDSSSILNPITKDVSSVVSEVIDASEVDNPVLQAMNYFLKTATFAAHQEVLVIEDKVDELINKVNKIDWELFEQTFSNSDSRKTGNLVFRFSQDYFDTLKELFRKARKASGANKKVYYKEALDFVKNNTLVFDVRKLFPDKELWGVEFSQEEIDAHVAELKANIGEIGYDEYLERAKEKLERYKDALAAQREVYLASHAGNSAIVDQLMQLWETNNSPAKAMEMMESTYELEKIGDKYITPTNRFVERIPLRYKNGKSTGYYDSKFEKIESDTNLRELYNYILETMSEMKQYLPYEETKWMQINSLPTIYKTVLEQYGEEGLHAGFAPLKDAFKEATRTSDISPVDKRIRNPLTGEVDKQVQTDMLIDYTAEINRLVELKVKEYNLNNETPATAEIIAEFKKDAADEVSKLKSFDLGKITKAFALMALTYKHKSSVQDVMEASSNLIKRQLEQQESAARKELLDSYGNPIPIKGLNNTRKMLNTLMDVYYGYQMDKPFGQTKKKVYTEREQALKERYEAVITKAKERLDEGKLTEDEFERIEALMNDQLDVLGGVRTWSKYGDLVLQYVQIKGMGWNVFAGVTNMLYGFVSNVTEASDGRNYNMEEFWTAQAKILSTIGGVNKFSPEAKKIRALMKNLDVLKQTRYELWKATQQGTMGKLKKTLAPLNPYNPQTSTEYINQATVMVAMLLHQKVTLNGETISLYNAYDQSGKLLDGVEFPEKIDENKVKIRIDAVISMNHGNYDPDKPINFKRNLLGRALSQFRTWAYQGFAERFMDERYSLALGISKKGRYRSYGAYYKAMSEQDYGAVMSSIYLLKQLLRKSTFGKYNTQFDQIEGLSEVDAANMRKNMTEIMFIIMLTTLALLLKASFDDGKNSKGKYIAFFWINQLTRLNTDMSFYVSPVQFEKLTKNAMPAFSLVIDVEKALDASWNYIVDPQSDILQSGSNKGDSKAARALSRLAPGPHQAVNRVKAASEQVFEDNR